MKCVNCGGTDNFVSVGGTHYCKGCQDKVCNPSDIAGEILPNLKKDSGTINFETKRKRLIEYLLMKVDEADWRGVSDAANDLRVLEAENKGNK